MSKSAECFESQSLEKVESAIRSARSCLLGMFESASERGESGRDDETGGYWVGELEADTTLESDYIVFLSFLDAEKYREKIRKLAAYVRRHQLDDGSWNIWYGGPGDVSATVKAYLALRLAGCSAEEPFMLRARDAVLRAGGAERVNSYTKFYLAMLHQIDWSRVPAIPPEVVLLPRFFWINIYEISYWSRAILIPLSILFGKRARRVPPGGNLVRELFVDPDQTTGKDLGLGRDGNGNGDAFGVGADRGKAGEAGGWSVSDKAGHRMASPETGDNGADSRLGRSRFLRWSQWVRNGAPGNGASGNGEGDRLFSWENFFWLTDRVLKMAEQAPVKPLRRRALKKAEEWIVSRFEDSDGLGAIFPSMVNSIMALRALGYDEGHPLIVKAMNEVQELEIEGKDEIRVQPCLSPVWDTAKAVNALHEAGVPSDNEQLVQACRWLVSKEVRRPGDWKVRRPRADVGGWYFQFRNEFYPDIDDTAAVVMALGRVSAEKVEGIEDSISRGINWLLNMQSSDGGWAAFDADVQREFLTKVPYADHNAMLDPSCADITGRCLEMFGRFPELMKEPPVANAVRRAVSYLKGSQESDGAWYGRWGVNYIYGTWQTLKGLMVVGEDPNQEYIRRAVKFLKSHQNADGGWGESCDSYCDPSLSGRGESTASQTAWAVMGLISAGEMNSAEVERGIRYLLDRQGPDGNWEEIQWTGTGFPSVFYLKYHLYRLYFPLFALGMYLNSQKGVSTIQPGAGRGLRERLSGEFATSRRSPLLALFSFHDSDRQSSG